MEELKASHEKSISDASDLHAKELEALNTQVEKLKQELTSAKDKTQELEKSVSELQPYKEQAQVRTVTFKGTETKCFNFSERNMFSFKGFFFYYSSPDDGRKASGTM